MPIFIWSYEVPKGDPWPDHHMVVSIIVIAESIFQAQHMAHNEGGVDPFYVCPMPFIFRSDEIKARVVSAHVS